MRQKKLIAASIIGIAIVLVAVYASSIKRLYTAITLYDEDKIAQNFVSMAQSFNVTTLSASSEPIEFPYQKADASDAVTIEDSPYKESVKDFVLASRTTGLMVIQDGNIVYEYYGETGGQDVQHMSFSVAKSFVSALFGIALSQGHVKSIDEPVVNYVPELSESGYRNVTIKDALQMSSGVKFNENYADFNSDINRFSRAIAFGTSLDDFTASLQSERPPGRVHHYVSIDTQVLGMVLVRATGMSLTEYAQQYLWEPLGMQDDAYWMQDDDGMELALGGLNITVRDYAKFGWLYANAGHLNGQQIVPADWVDASTHAQDEHVKGSNDIENTVDYGYGYQWWLPPGRQDEFMARGIYDQYIYVDPDAKVVIVKTSANHRFNDKSLQWSSRHLALFRQLAKFYSTHNN
ncbi:serine hydrolase domain-containing protein [Alteromonas facilis]|uniref:serine hydrolase domain-containing protein n=1 Tax=Alteromonas facilis TaxID=2048004 RepID=UPI000C29107B|nr:serine hydrolase [Alteromonas facilis]